MNLSIKISLYSFLTIIFSILILLIILNNTSPQLSISNSISHDDFFIQEFDSQNEKIFLIGSSHVGRVNSTYIQDQLSLHNKSFDVYNLALSADTPSNRLKSMDNILSIDPSLVVYGLGFRDFSEFVLKSELKKPKNILPDLSYILPNTISIFEESFNVNTDNFKSPKIITIQNIKIFFGLDEIPMKSQIPQKNTPFYIIVPGYSIPLNDAELKRALYSNPYILSDIDPKSENISALEEIISIFQDNNIPVILYSTPKSGLFLDSMSLENKNLFSSILNDISKEQNVQVHFLHDKYTNENIWNNNMHIITGSNNVVHNDDIAEIIINFLDE